MLMLCHRKGVSSTEGALWISHQGPDSSRRHLIKVALFRSSVDIEVRILSNSVWLDIVSVLDRQIKTEAAD